MLDIMYIHKIKKQRAINMPIPEPHYLKKPDRAENETKKDLKQNYSSWLPVFPLLGVFLGSKSSKSC